MIKTVVREHHWCPDQIGKLKLDDEDYLGLEFWYNDVITVINELKPKTK
jgi:hypothetical protein